MLFSFTKASTLISPRERSLPLVLTGTHCSGRALFKINYIFAGAKHLSLNLYWVPCSATVNCGTVCLKYVYVLELASV